MAVQISYRRVRKLRLFRIKLRTTKARVLMVILFALTMWVALALLFYYVEHVRGGRQDIDLETSLYWSLITMATIGYGDVTPSPGAGYVVSGIAAIVGIAVYTLTISIIADSFLNYTLSKIMGRGKLKKKQVIVIGQTEVCREVLEELSLNGLEDEVGLVLREQPRKPPKIDYVVGEIDEETLKRAGIEDASHAIVCTGEDTDNMYTALLVKKLNPRIKVSVHVHSPRVGELLKQAGIEHVIPSAMIGRLLASTVFEPHIPEVIAELASAEGQADMVELRITKETRVSELEKELEDMTGQKHRIIAVYRKGTPTLLPEPDYLLKPGDNVVCVRALTSHDNK